MNIFHEDQAAWLAQVLEPAVEPERRIIDPHHHLFPELMGNTYNIEDYAADVRGGHNVIGSMFIECGASYRQSGPQHEKPLGETAYVLAQAARTVEIEGCPPMLGMIGHVDLCDANTLDGVLDQHIELAGDFFKGIRHAGATARDGDREQMLIPGSAPADLYRQPAFQASVRRLGARGLTFDAWHYHYQIQDFIDLARACPDTTLVMDHFATPLGVASFAGKHAEIFETWKADMRALKECPNVFLKLGGLAMPDNGFGWHLAEKPPTSNEVVDAQGDWYRFALESFGPQRCMFESNFPVDRMSLSFSVYCNAMKKITTDFSEDDKEALFWETANRVYSLGE